MPPLPPPIDQIWRRVRGCGDWQDFGHAQGHCQNLRLSDDGSEQVACRLRLLPDRPGGVGDHAERLPLPDHGQVPLAPFLGARRWARRTRTLKAESRARRSPTLRAHEVVLVVHAGRGVHRAREPHQHALDVEAVEARALPRVAANGG